MVAGEFIADIAGAYLSVMNVLKAEIENNGIPFQGTWPISWGKVSLYGGMKCSVCGQLRPCMRSAREWEKEVARRNGK